MWNNNRSQGSLIMSKNHTIFVHFKMGQTRKSRGSKGNTSICWGHFIFTDSCYQWGIVNVPFVTTYILIQGFMPDNNEAFSGFGNIKYLQQCSSNWFTLFHAPMQSNTGKLGDARNSCCPKWKLQPQAESLLPVVSVKRDTFVSCSKRTCWRRAGGQQRSARPLWPSVVRSSSSSVRSPCTHWPAREIM